MSADEASVKRSHRGLSRRLADHPGGDGEVRLSESTVRIGPSYTPTGVTVAVEGDPGAVERFSTKSMRAGG